MKFEEPKLRYATEKAINELASELGLPENTQDWEWIVGKSENIEKYINHYNILTDDDKKFILMEVIIQAATDLSDDVSFIKFWNIIKQLLKENFTTHEYSIFYWCCFDTENINDCWQITPYVRQLWFEVKPERT